MRSQGPQFDRTGVLLRTARDTSATSLSQHTREDIWGHSEKATVCSQEGTESSPETKPVSSLILGFKHPEPWENKFLSFQPPRLRYYTVWQPEQTNRRGRGAEKLGSPQWAFFLFGTVASGPGSWQLWAHRFVSRPFGSAKAQVRAAASAGFGVALQPLVPALLCPGKAWRKKALWGWSVKVYSIITGNGNLIGSF